MRDPGQVAFYHSKEWLAAREAYISKVGGMCERCLAKGIVRPGYIVHHRIHINTENISDPTILLSFDNLEYLCLECHNLEHFGGEKRYYVDENGKVIAR